MSKAQEILFDQDIIKDFLVEMREYLDEFEPLLVSLENDDGDFDSNINALFRMIHSIKGSAGFIGLNAVQEVTHNAESLLDNIRKKKIELQPNHIDILLETIDFLRGVNHALGETVSEEPYLEFANEINRQFQETNANQELDDKISKNINDANPKKENDPDSDTLDDLTIDDLITPDMIKQYRIESLDVLQSAEQDLLKLETDDTNRELASSAMGHIHSIKGSSLMMGYGDVGKILHQMESFLEEIHEGKIDGESEKFTLMLSVLDEIRKAIFKMDESTPPILSNREILLDMMAEFLSMPEHETKDTTETIPDTKNVDSVEPKPSAAFNENVTDLQPAPTTNGNNNSSFKMQNEIIRVDVEKLNHLLDIVGEILVSESMVSQHLDISHVESQDFEKSVTLHQKNIRELQDIAMSMRLITLNGLFKKMIRLVRDLSNKSHKKTELLIDGGETEVDRSIIEHISDPLVHIIRNSIDHGIESAEERKKAGKPPVAKVHLSATQSGSEIVIKITDDGKGLDTKKIAKKAFEKGLITTTHLPDKEIYELIFKPGFSTADKITDISGRGVGLDVVIKNVEQIRGNINIDSKKGEGTSFELRFPLTTAIVECLIVRVGNIDYGIPLLDINESLQADSKQVTELIDKQEYYRIREKMVPVVRLSELFKFDTAASELADGILVHCQVGDESIAVFADDVVDQYALVVKSLPDYTSDSDYLSGCAIKGDGGVIMLLDLRAILEISKGENVT